MDHLTALDRAGAGCIETVSGIGADQWDHPTVCDDWSVRQLVQHLLGGARMATVLAEGGTRDEAIAALDAPLHEGDAVARLEAAFAEEAAAFARPGVLEQTLHHPATDLPGADVLGFRITDRAVHGWDLARATGQDEALDPEVVEVVWAGAEPMIPMLPSIGIFGDGPSGDVGPDADLQTRVLDALGRRP